MLLALTMHAMPALGCTVGTQMPDVDLPAALASNEVAFVARLTDYRRLPLGVGDAYFLGSIGYERIESIKGSTESHATLVEWTGEPAMEGMPPGPACGPFVATPGNNGATFLIFASRDNESGHLRPDPRSPRLDVPGAEQAKWLALIRTTHHNPSTP